MNILQFIAVTTRDKFSGTGRTGAGVRHGTHQKHNSTSSQKSVGFGEKWKCNSTSTKKEQKHWQKKRSRITVLGHKNRSEKEEGKEARMKQHKNSSRAMIQTRTRRPEREHQERKSTGGKESTMVRRAPKWKRLHQGRRAHHQGSRGDNQNEESTRLKRTLREKRSFGKESTVRGERGCTPEDEYSTQKKTGRIIYLPLSPFIAFHYMYIANQLLYPSIPFYYAKTNEPKLPQYSPPIEFTFLPYIP